MTPTHPWQADLAARWAEPHRHHHDREHLDEVLAAVAELSAAGETFDREAVELAAWFHDAVYDPRSDDNEERSAALVGSHLGDGALAREVERLVLLTKTHRVEPGDRNGAALSDADLSILAADPDRYARYAEEVRVEYAHVPAAEFASGRAAVLSDLLELPALFATRTGQERWEDAARRNVSAEVERLRRG